MWVLETLEPLAVLPQRRSQGSGGEISGAAAVMVDGRCTGELTCFTDDTPACAAMPVEVPCHALFGFRVPQVVEATGGAVPLDDPGTLVRLGAAYGHAQVQSEEALTMARRHHCIEDEALRMGVLGYVAFHTGRHDAALSNFEQGDTLLHDVGDTYYRAIVLDYLGRTHLAVDDITAAGRTWELALQLYREQHRTTEAEDLQKRRGMLTWQRVGVAAQ